MFEIAAYTVSSVGKLDAFFHCLPICSINVIDFIYLLCYDGPHLGFTIRVYDARIPHDLLMITIAHYIDKPFNMVVIENTNTLYMYIGDEGCECIWKIDTQKNEVYKWLSGLGEQISLSVTNDFNLLVLRLSNDLLYLDIYDKDAKLERRMSLPNDFEGPFDAIQVPNGEFIVSHNMAKEDVVRLCVSFLNVDGQIVSQFQLNKAVGFRDAKVFHYGNDVSAFAIEMFSKNVYIHDLSALEWNLTELIAITSNNTDESFGTIIGLQNTDGRKVSDIMDTGLLQFVQLFWDPDNQNLLAAENVFGDLYLFDTKSGNWSKIGRLQRYGSYLYLRHHRLHYDERKIQINFIRREGVEMLALTKY